MSKYHVVAYATSDAGYSKFFDLSCREVGGFEPVIVGLGREWIGFASGFIYLVEWLKSIDTSDIVLVCDRYDVIFTAPLKETIFAEFEAGEIANPGKDYFYISADLNKLFQRSFWGPLKAQKCQINSGTYVMRAGPLLKMLTDILTAFSGRLKEIDDQRQITNYLNDHENEIAVGVDHTKHVLLFPRGDFNTGRKLRMRARPGLKYKTLHYKTTRIAIVHRPGNADLTQMLKDLGYANVGKHINDYRTFYQLSKLPTNVKYYAMNPKTVWRNVTTTN